MEEIKAEIEKRLIELNNIGKDIIGKVKGTDQKEVKGTIIDEVSHMTDNENKYVIQKLELSDNNISYRIGYYTYDSNKTRLYYGESSPIIDSETFVILVNKAKDKGWF